MALGINWAQMGMGGSAPSDTYKQNLRVLRDNLTFNGLATLLAGSSFSPSEDLWTAEEVRPYNAQGVIESEAIAPEQTTKGNSGAAMLGGSSAIYPKSDAIGLPEIQADNTSYQQEYGMAEEYAAYTIQNIA